MIKVSIYTVSNSYRDRKIYGDRVLETQMNSYGDNYINWCENQISTTDKRKYKIYLMLKAIIINEAKTILFYLLLI